jgi:hypothetical protein
MAHGNILRTLLICLGLLFVTVSSSDDGHAFEKEPTAIVVDAETGEPIEGAVAIAIWRKRSFADRWFEGGTWKVVRVEEAISDREGKIFIDGFWTVWDSLWTEDKDTPILWRSPHLTIYKFGYVCWDQFLLFPGIRGGKRNDFDKRNRTARMAKWPNGFTLNNHWEFEGFSFVDHEGFINSVTMGDIHESSQMLFRKALDMESKYCIKEYNVMDEHRKQMEREKKRIKQ